jgi:hypothetical protein
VLRYLRSIPLYVQTVLSRSLATLDFKVPPGAGVSAIASLKREIGFVPRNFFTNRRCAFLRLGSALPVLSESRTGCPLLSCLSRLPTTEAYRKSTRWRAQKSPQTSRRIASNGQNADLVLVEGDASERLSDLRQTRVVNTRWQIDGRGRVTHRC